MHMVMRQRGRRLRPTGSAQSQPGSAGPYSALPQARSMATTARSWASFWLRQDRGQCLSQAHSHRMLQACLLTGHCRPFFRPNEMKMPPNGLSHTSASLLRQGTREQNGLSKRAYLLTDILAGAIKVRPYPRGEKSDQETR